MSRQLSPRDRVTKPPNDISLAAAARRYGRRFLCSTSGWNGLHLSALRVLRFADLHLHRVCPADFTISNDSVLAQKVRQSFSLTTAEVQERRYSPMSFERTFYNELGALIRTAREARSRARTNRNTLSLEGRSRGNFDCISPPDRDAGAILSLSSRSDSSDASCKAVQSSWPTQSPPKTRDERLDPREVVTNNMVCAFVEIPSALAYPDVNPLHQRPEFSACPDSIKLRCNTYVRHRWIGLETPIFYDRETVGEDRRRTPRHG